MFSKKAPKSNAERQRQFRQREYEAKGDAWLFTACRECGKPIAPSFKRGFCPGNSGKNCREKFFKKIQVRSWFPITFADRSLSAEITKERA